MVEKQPPPQQDDETISLEGDDESIGPAGGQDASARAPGSTLRSFGGGGLKKDTGPKFRRTPVNTGRGAVRCRLFHAKVAVGSLEYMENQINEWIDGNDIDVKHVGHVIGVMEGKTQEPNLLVMVWF